jgi:N-acetyl-anhydromuramyl-L-alanine amidase AmpD
VALQTPLTAQACESLIASWEERYPEVKSPGHLYPSKSPNRDYAGIEMTPCGTHIKGRWTWLWGTQPYPGARFSVEQMTALASLLGVWATQLGFAYGWQDTPGRLVGHEDINPITRYGWDPGAYKEWMQWDTLKAMIRTLSALA